MRDDFVFPLHLHIGASPPSGFGQSEEGMALQRCAVFLSREQGQLFYFFQTSGFLTVISALLYIHRTYFCRAASEMPLNPLNHRFGPSILATFKGAIAMIDAMMNIFEEHPMLTRRLVPIYSFAFSAASTLGALVVLAPRWSHASQAFMYLGKVYALFECAEMPQVLKLKASAWHRNYTYSDRLPSSACPVDASRESTGRLHAPSLKPK